MTTESPQPCLSEDVLFQLARNNLSPTAIREIEQHVTDCLCCRELLDGASADLQWREEICRILKSPNQSFRFAIDHEQIGNEVESLASIMRLLGPTDDPGMLGRIGSYEVVGVIGHGGMGVVVKAFDATLNRFVAIKMLLPHLAQSGAARKRFKREGQAAAAVIDDNVMPIYSVAEWQSVPYLVTQYCSGVTLQKRIEQQGPLELQQILRIGCQTARGLAAAHAQGLVHRDVKPSNILLDETVERAMLTDFGLARAIDDASITRTGVIVGTPQYMSPEQVRSNIVDARSDLFGLGGVLYAMCTGRPPFRADNSYAILRLITDEEPPSIREMNPEIPEWVCSIICKLMSKQPQDRYRTAVEVSKLFEDCLAHVQQPQTNALPCSLVNSTSTGRSYFSARYLGAIAMLGTICFGLLAMVLLRSPDQQDQSPQSSSQTNSVSGDIGAASDTEEGKSASGKASQITESPNQEFLQRAQNQQNNLFHILPFTVNDEGQVIGLSLREFQLRPGDAKIISRMTKLTRLTLQSCNVVDDDLDELAKLSNLEELSLWESKVGDLGVPGIVGLKNLKVLELGATQVTDSSLPLIAKLTNLRQIGLARTRVTDAGLKSLLGMRHLQGLKLSDTRISDQGLETLRAIPALRGITLDGTDVTAEGLAKFADHEGFGWMATDEGIANELARRKSAGDTRGVDSMRSIGLDLPNDGQFTTRSVTAHPISEKDIKLYRRRFRVEWNWSHDGRDEGLFAELAILQRTARIIEIGVIE